MQQVYMTEGCPGLKYMPPKVTDWLTY